MLGVHDQGVPVDPPPNTESVAGHDLVPDDPQDRARHLEVEVTGVGVTNELSIGLDAGEDGGGPDASATPRPARSSALSYPYEYLSVGDFLETRKPRNTAADVETSLSSATVRTEPPARR